MSKEDRKTDLPGYEHDIFLTRLEELRVNAGISKKKLVSVTLGENSYSTYQRWYNGERKPRESTIKRIAEYFHCDPRYLYRADFSTLDIYGEVFEQEKEQFLTGHGVEISFLQSIGYTVEYLPAGGSGDKFGNTDLLSCVLISDREKKEYYFDEVTFQNLFRKIALEVEKELINASEGYPAHRIRSALKQ